MGDELRGRLEDWNWINHRNRTTSSIYNKYCTFNYRIIFCYSFKSNQKAFDLIIFLIFKA